MRKEILIAVSAGATLGLIVAATAFILSSRREVKPLPSFVPASPSETTTNFKGLTINSPANGVVIKTATVKVSGKAPGSSYIIISGENKDILLNSDPSGTFEKVVDLTPGINQIKVTSIDENGNQGSSKIIVVYSSSFSQTESVPEAYIGLVTDITDSTIQIKSLESTIKQISVGVGPVTVVNIKGTNNKTVKMTDLAIGDFIVAMGFINRSGVLETQRILISDPVTEPIEKVYSGNYSDISLPKDKNTSFYLFSGGDLTKISSLVVKPTNGVIYTTTITAKGETLRTIFVISS